MSTALEIDRRGADTSLSALRDIPPTNRVLFGLRQLTPPIVRTPSNTALAPSHGGYLQVPANMSAALERELAISEVESLYRNDIQRSRAALEAADNTSTPALEELAHLAPSARTDGFGIIISRLAALMREDDADDRPTAYAFLRALAILLETRALIDAPVPRGSAATTDARGIHLYWKGDSRTLQLAIPDCAHGVSFIYHRVGDDYAAEQPVSARTLADWLRWFSDA